VPPAGVASPIPAPVTPHLAVMCAGLLATVYGRLRDSRPDRPRIAHLCSGRAIRKLRGGCCRSALFPHQMGCGKPIGALLSVWPGGTKRTGQVILLFVPSTPWSRGQAGQVVQCLNPDGPAFGGGNRAFALLPFIPCEPAFSAERQGDRARGRQEPMFWRWDALRPGLLWLVTDQPTGRGLGQDRSAIDHLTNQVGGAGRQGSPLPQGLGRTASCPRGKAGQQRRT